MPAPFGFCAVLYVSLYPFEGAIRYALDNIRLRDALSLRDGLIFLPIALLLLKQAFHFRVHPAFFIFAGTVLLHGTLSTANLHTTLPTIYGAMLLLNILFGFIAARQVTRPGRRVLSIRWPLARSIRGRGRPGTRSAGNRAARTCRSRSAPKRGVRGCYFYRCDAVIPRSSAGGEHGRPAGPGDRARAVRSSGMRVATPMPARCHVRGFSDHGGGGERHGLASHKRACAANGDDVGAKIHSGPAAPGERKPRRMRVPHRPRGSALPEPRAPAGRASPLMRLAITKKCH
jgi:hypothetical protein